MTILRLLGTFPVEGSERGESTLGRLLRERTHELEGALEESRRSRCFLERVVECMSSGLWVFDAEGRAELVNDAAAALCGASNEDAHARDAARLFPGLSLTRDVRVGQPLRVETRLARADGSSIPVLVSASIATTGTCQSIQIVVSCQDLSEQRALETRLDEARKLEAVGQLAAGVAHEVNTPIQFVGDSVCFLRDCVRDLATVVEQQRTFVAELTERGVIDSADRDRFSAIHADADLDFVLAEAPSAIQRSLRGISRVADIVRALRAFSHPDQQTVAPSDVNTSIRDAAMLARVECKRVAELVVDLGVLPLVDCNLNELNQVFLNLIVNASHAIEERGGGRGTIVVRSAAGPDHVEVTVTDDGGGIPEAIRGRIFEPFFTTKVLGKGTGQGLALAHAFVESHHFGELSFTTSLGVGTTFKVRLPLRRSLRPSLRP